MSKLWVAGIAAGSRFVAQDDMNQRVREEVQRRRQAAELVDEPTTIIRAATAPQDAKPSR